MRERARLRVEVEHAQAGVADPQFAVAVDLDSERPAAGVARPSRSCDRRARCAGSGRRPAPAHTSTRRRRRRRPQALCPACRRRRARTCVRCGPASLAPWRAGGFHTTGSSEGLVIGLLGSDGAQTGGCGSYWISRLTVRAASSPSRRIDEVQCHVDPGRHPRRGDHVAVVDVAVVGQDLDGRVERGRAGPAPASAWSRAVRAAGRRPRRRATRCTRWSSACRRSCTPAVRRAAARPGISRRRVPMPPGKSEDIDRPDVVPGCGRAVRAGPSRRGPGRARNGDGETPRPSAEPPRGPSSSAPPTARRSRVPRRPSNRAIAIRMSAPYSPARWPSAAWFPATRRVS